MLSGTGESIGIIRIFDTMKTSAIVSIFLSSINNEKNTNLYEKCFWLSLKRKKVVLNKYIEDSTYRLGMH